MSQYVTTPDGKRHVFPDEATPDQIRSALFSKPDSTAVPFTPLESPPPDFQGRAIDALPMAGGLAGGLSGAAAGAAIGAPFAGIGAIPGAAIGGVVGGIGGAGLGGSTGEGLRQKLAGEPLSVGKQVRSGAEQAFLEALGIGAVKAAGGTAKVLTSRSYGNVTQLAKRFSRKTPGATRLTPEDIYGMLREDKVTATHAGEAAARQMGDEARIARGNIFARTTATIGPGALAKKAITDAENALGRNLTTAERRALVAKVENEANRILTERSHGVVPKNPATPAKPASTVLNQFGRPAIPAKQAVKAPTRYTAREVEQIKEVAARDAKSTYKADLEATSVAADPTLSRQIADAARAKLRKIPGVKEQTAIIRRSMIEQQAVGNALARGNREWTPIHIGPISIGAKLPRDKMSRLAVLFDNPEFQKYLKQSPRAAALAIHQLIYQSPEVDSASAQ